MAYLEPEYGQEIYCLAPKLDQAALVYDGFYQMVQAEDELAELAKKRRSDIYIAESNTVIKPIAFNAKKSDGFNPQLVVCDEMAAWSGDAGLKQYEVMKSALGARTQPMILSISTAGYINDSIYDELMKRSTSFLKGNSKERRLLPFLYMIDEVVSIFKNMALCGLPVKKVWEKVREFLAKYTDELPDTDELDGDSTTGNVEERRTQER